MPEPEQVIEERRGEVAALAVLAHARRAVALGQRRAVGADDQRRRARSAARQPERGENQQLARRIGQVVLAAQHVRHPHAGIVHGIAKKNAAEPSARRTTKSPMSSLAKLCGPCTKSIES